MEPIKGQPTRRSARKAKAATPDDDDVQEIIPLEDQGPSTFSTKQYARRTGGPLPERPQWARKSVTRPLKRIELPDEDDVRAPIPQQQGVLSGGDPFALMSNPRASSSSGFFTDLRAQYREQTLRIKTDAKRSHQQAFLEDTANLSQRPSNKPRLYGLYAPPEKIMTIGCFDDVREKAVRKARWLLVNIHKYDEFVCQLFMRECLKHEAVQEIIAENFVFWNVDFDSREGLRYITHYKVEEYPHLAIIDPRTGEKVETYGKKMKALDFCNVITTFLAERPSYDPKALEKVASTSSAPPPKTERQGSESSGSVSSGSVQIIDPEEEEIQKAIELSKKEEEARKRKAGEIIDIDDILYDNDEDSQEPESEEKSVEVIEQVEPEIKTEIKEEKPEPTVNEDAWKEFSGDANDPSLTLKIRVPTGAALELSLPSTSQLQALFLFLAGRGFSMDKYDTIVHFQKKNLSLLPSTTLLKDSGLANREVLIVSEKE